MKHNIIPTLLALALTGLTWRAAAESTELAANPTGNWQLSLIGTNGQRLPAQKLRLKLETGRVTGALTRQAGYKVEQVPLLKGKLTGNDISFETHTYAVSYIKNVLQPTDTNKWSHAIYQGTLSGDTIKGKVERESWLGNKHTMEFEATRAK
ncbi:MAG TPA: hypothetical protein VMU04_06885 [Candidatus Acidoferrum sp.]|nr:hypothetical protein [Candidatus Acidoferrum sp.]